MLSETRYGKYSFAYNICVRCVRALRTKVKFYWNIRKKSMDMDTLFTELLSFSVLCGLLTHFPSMSTIQFHFKLNIAYGVHHFYFYYHVKSAESCETIRIQWSTICVQILHVAHKDSVSRKKDVKVLCVCMHLSLQCT